MVFTTARGWALSSAGQSSARSSAGSYSHLASSPCRCSSIATSAPPKRCRPHGALRTRTRREMFRWGLIVTGAAGARLDPAVRRARVRAALARLFDLAPLHAPDRPRGDSRGRAATSRPLLPSTFSSRKRSIVFWTCAWRAFAGDMVRLADVEHHVEGAVGLLELVGEHGRVFEDHIVVRHSVQQQERLLDFRRRRRAHPTSRRVFGSIAGLPR